MSYQDLLARSKTHLSQFPLEQEYTLTPFVFTQGAKWMMQRLNELDGKQRNFHPRVPYELYGYLKYFLCLFFFILSGWFLWSAAIYLSLLAILVFYFLEVHFLFLFPLLIEGEEQPLAKSVQMTYKVGMFTAIKTVIPIGIFMVTGFLKWRNPLKHWYVGCLAVLIWYVDERD